MLSLLSGFLLFLGWPPFGSTLLLFIAFVPLLYMEDAFAGKKVKARSTLLFGLSFLTFFIWNFTTTWWVANASIGGGAMAILANSFIMAAIFWIFHLVKKRFDAYFSSGFMKQADWLLILFWLGYEFFHHRWDLTWPWLALGNAFAANHRWIQWYEFTGTPGGTFWVLIVNVMIFRWLNGNRKMIYTAAGTILLPIIGSLLLYSGYEEKQDPVRIVTVQPNIDPYNEKFSGLTFDEQLNKMLELASEKTDSTVDYLVFPETALTEDIWENEFKFTGSYHRLKEFLKRYPKLKIVTGASTWHLYQPGEPLSVTARKFKKQEGYYDAFNTAFQVDNSDRVQVYHKSKLVPGGERMPYPIIFGFLEDLAIDLGGTSGSLGTQEERTVFTSEPGSGTTTGIAPVICYESIFGEYVSEYVHNGSNLVFIITNDGWWGDTPGYKQHLIYGRLRAIETRRSIARSANTGISCFIDQRGDISQETQWWEPAVIRDDINRNEDETFYVKFGDLLGRFSFYLSGLFLALSVFFRFQKKRISTLS